MHPGFPVFPRDSLLLGLAIGEFLRLGELGGDDTFEEVLYRRVHPFYPDMAREMRIPIDDQDLPSGLTWYEVGEGVQRSGPAMPDVDDRLDVRLNVDPFAVAAANTFERRGNKLSRVIIDESERNMLDRLVEYLTFDDGEPQIRWNEQRAVLARWKISEKSKSQRRFAKPVSEIERLIEDLVVGRQMSVWQRDANRLKPGEADAGSTLRRTFSVGKILGRAFAECVAAEVSLIRLEETRDGVDEGTYVADEYRPDDSNRPLLVPEIEKTWDDLVVALASDPIFLHCCLSADWLRSGKAFWGGRYFGLSRANDPAASDINLTLCVRTTLCLILGEIMGVLRDKHREAEIRDSEQPIPRKLSIPLAASREQIGGALHLLEHAIKGESGAQYPAELVIELLGRLIEALCRQLWPFGPKQTVREILDQKRKAAQTSLEAEFAEKSLFFYRIYRNPSEHPHKPFRCSAYEGPLFFYAMRSLNDLAQRILAERAAIP